jgi:superfamily II DNA/RNA helicase
MSSHAAAVAALENRQAALPEEAEEDPDFRPFIYESSEDQTDDGQPTPPIEAAEPSLPASEKRRLSELRRMAEALQTPRGDAKLTKCAELVSELLNDGFSPILWCRYIATAEYVARELQRALHRSLRGLQVVSITSHDGDDEVRGAKLGQISIDAPRVLVATDCLSEGINLQDKFNAAIHYDLPWNPNRLEQREGRVDRYGQNATVVKTIRWFSPDSAIDGIVLDVLLNKAREIHKALGTYVPVPEESETVTEALLQALFLRSRRPGAETRNSNSASISHPTCRPCTGTGSATRSANASTVPASRSAACTRRKSAPNWRRPTRCWATPTPCGSSSSTPPSG